MQKEEGYEILKAVLCLNGEICHECLEGDGDILEVRQDSHLLYDEGRCCDKYIYRNPKSIWIERYEDESLVKRVCRSLYEIIWTLCKLNHVCRVYKNSYDKWSREDANGLPYIMTKIKDDADEEGSMISSLSFMEEFCARKKDSDDGFHLKMLMADYGVGKSSFCQGFRNYISDNIKEPFLQGDFAFPFVFDLNDFRSGDFDQYILAELSGKYGISLTFSVFEMLCQSGIFTVVLDAWDQMRSARTLYSAKQDLSQMDSLWKKDGFALITCRRSFYQQQLKQPGNLSQNVGLYSLQKFDEESVIDYLVKDSCSRKEQGLRPVISNPEEWVSRCWRLNERLLSKPLNLMLLTTHFDTISRKLNIEREEVDTYRFLRLILSDWENKNPSYRKEYLKKFVLLTLRNGLNRSITIEEFKKGVSSNSKSGDLAWNEFINALTKFDFVKVDNEQTRIGFRLAAYQEFLWADFVLEELYTESNVLEKESSLLKSYLLTREVRGWICEAMDGEETDCLKNKVLDLKYKSVKFDYQASNALTLICDLYRYEFYKNQFIEMKENDFKYTPLRGTDFRHKDLTGANFEGADLEGANFSFAILDRARFSYSKLQDTLWQEHGRLKKCAFLHRDAALCVAAGTTNGSVLTYSIHDNEADNRQELVNLWQDVINDLAGDRNGIYTAFSDGWVGYIDQCGNLKNAYIAQSGLQSIVHTQRSNYVYVGSDNQEIYRYNWKSGTKQQIFINKELGGGSDKISDIRFYCGEDGEEYIAYTLRNRKLLVFLKLVGSSNGEVVATGSIETDRYVFGDICFAGEWLIYSVVGEGIFYIPVKEAFGSISEGELLSDSQRLLECRNAVAFSLRWADSVKELMVIKHIPQQTLDNAYFLRIIDKKVNSGEERDIDWLYRGYDYSMQIEEIEGFSISDDGKYIAVSGESLAVFHCSGAGFYSLVEIPIKAKLSCENTNFEKCEGLTESQKRFLISRGASNIE